MFAVPLAMLAVVVMAGSARAAELPRHGGMYPTGGGPPLAVVDSTIEVTVRGPLVEAVVTQRFRNATDRATEATYIFPLPPDAAVSAMSIAYGNRTIRAAIERREAALRRYEDAVRAGVVASVLDQERPDVFTQTVTGIPPRSTVEVTLRFDTVARYHAGTWELVLPMVVAPRYVPGVATSRPTTGSGRAPDTDRAPDASRVTPGGAPGAGGATKVVLTFIDKVDQLASPTHELAVTATGGTFTDPKSDHDAIVRWRATAPAAGWAETARDGGYAAVLVEAPAAPAKRAAVQLTLVLDRAATSRGDAEALALPVVRQLFATMTTADRVAVAGSQTVAATLPANAARAVAERWEQPAGAFDLTRVLAALRPNGGPVVLVTGALVADDRAAVAAARKLGVPIHVIGVGPAPARGLLSQIASVSGGTLRFAAPGDDLVALARSVLADAAAPPPPLAVTWGALAASEVVPGVLPRLGHGQAMLVLARVKKAHTANARARGDLFAIEMLPAPRAVDGATTTYGPLARRWARARIDELLATARPNPTAVTQLALRYGLVTPFTSFVAVGDEVVVEGGTKRSIAVPVSVPAGMKWEQVKRETTVNTRADTRGEKATRPTAKTQAPTPPPAKEPVIDSTVVTGSTAPVAQGAIEESSVGTDDAEDEADGNIERDAEPTRLAHAPAGDSYEVLAISSERMNRPFRISPAIGGGILAREDGSRGLLSLGLRFELGRGRSLFGVHSTLWLDRDDTQGRVLFTFARLGIARWLELGAGVGTQLGTAGIGPAAAVDLRLRVRGAPRAAGYLRYDAALVIEETTREGQNALTLGVEYGF